MRRKNIFLERMLLVLAALFLNVIQVAAQVEGPGGHFYQVVMEPQLLWQDAKARAEAMTFNGQHGHLATITSLEEDAFIETLRQEAAPGGYGSLWVGGMQEPGAASPTSGWFWVNGEGPIPMQAGETGYANWQPTEPNDYWGPNSEAYLSVGHFNTFGWNDEPDDRHIFGYVVEFPGRGTAATVSIAAVDPIAVESAANGIPPNPAQFVIRREGDVSLDLPVFYSVHGTARNAIDYQEISQSVIIPAGQASVDLMIHPLPDSLTVVEPLETVALRLEPSLILTPEASYRINETKREAVAVIYEGTTTSTRTTLNLALPRNSFVYGSGEPITILAVMEGTNLVNSIDFYANETNKLGSATYHMQHNNVRFFKFTWENPPPGWHLLYARSGTSPNVLTSNSSRVMVEGTPQPSTVSIRYVDPATTEPVPDADFARGYFDIHRTGSTAANLQVFYSVGGTAMAGVDYEQLMGYVVIGAGRTNARVNIVAIDDQIDEPTETVVVTLVPSGGGGNTPEPTDYQVDPQRSSGQLPILDNDDPADLPIVSIEAITVNTVEPRRDYGPGPVPIIAPGRFLLTRSGSLANTLTVSLAYGGSATPGVDYNQLPPSITFSPGSSEVTLYVTPIMDDLAETNETVVVTLSPRATYQVNPQKQSATVVIRDGNTPAPYITIDTPQNHEFFRVGSSITITATAVDPNGVITRLSFYAFDTKIGESAIDFLIPPPNGTPITHTFIWNNVPGGIYHISARAVTSSGEEVRSDAVQIQVGGNASTSVISVSASPEEIVEPSFGSNTVPARVIVSRMGSITNAQRVYLKYEGTATAGPDYEAGPSEVIIPPGRAFTEFFVRARTDSNVEETETVIVRIAPPIFPTNPDPANTLYEINHERRSATIRILDQPGNDFPTVGIFRVVEFTREPTPNEDTAPAVFLLRRTGLTNVALPVFLSYAGTATPNVDYSVPGNIIQIPAGRSEVRVEIYAKDDTLIEGTESIIVAIAGDSGGAPSPYRVDPSARSVELNILDNDILQGEDLVRVIAEDPYATEALGNGDPARFRIMRLGNTNQPLQVFYSLHGTAKNGEDYHTLPNPVTLLAGQQSAVVDVIPISDGLIGGAHYYEVVPTAGLSWEEARNEAAQRTRDGVRGHLATITSAAEDELIESLRQASGSRVLWVGGYQEPGETSITDGWKWVNNEGPIPGTNDAGGYANWLPGEPNDYWGPASENHMVIGWLGSMGWNDQGANIPAEGFVVEFDLPGTGTNRFENLETVTIRLEESPLANPLPGYVIDPTNRMAVAVIFERQLPTNIGLDVAYPSPNMVYPPGETVEFLVAAHHPSLNIDVVEFWVDNQRIGTSIVQPQNPAMGGLIVHRLVWASATPGQHVLQARATTPDGQSLMSTAIMFTVDSGGGGNEKPIVNVIQPTEGAVFTEGQPIEIRAEASDPDGFIQRINLVIDGNIVAVTNGSVLHFVWQNAGSGTHNIAAHAFDNQNALSESALIHILVRHPDEISFVQRQLPGAYAPGVPFLVELHASPPDGTRAYAVQDRPPVGWVVSAISHGGFFDGRTGFVKFGPFTDSTNRVLAYRITPPANATGSFEFTGSSSLNGAIYPITGNSSIEPNQQHHPADRNMDFVIDLSEVTAYAAAWKAGESWPTGPAPIPMSYVTSAGLIWRRGEVYLFDPSRGAAPACWVPVDDGGPRAALASAAVGTAERSVSGEFRPGVPTQVQIIAQPGLGSNCYALEERPPRDWIVSNVSDGGVYDPHTGTVRWGAFMDSASRVLSYSVTPPAAVADVGTFSGQISVDGLLVNYGAARSESVDGSTPIRITNCIRGDNGTRLQISGAAGQTAVIEASSDFVNWTEVKSIFMPSSSAEFIDESSTNELVRFYRLRVQ